MHDISDKIISFLALTVRFMTKRFIGEYDSSSGMYTSVLYIYKPVFLYERHLLMQL